MKFIFKKKVVAVMLQTDNDEIYMLEDSIWYGEPGADGANRPVTDPELIKELIEAYNNYQ